MSGPMPAVDVIDVLAEAAHDTYFMDDRLPDEGIERNLWRNVVRAVRTAAEPYTYPTPEAYEAACAALETQRARATTEHARSYQLAIQFEDLLRTYEALVKEHWAGIVDDMPESAQEIIDEFREQFEESCCTGDHTDGPHVPFHKTGATT